MQAMYFRRREGSTYQRSCVTAVTEEKWNNLTVSFFLLFSRALTFLPFLCPTSSLLAFNVYISVLLPLKVENLRLRCTSDSGCNNVITYLKSQDIFNLSTIHVFFFFLILFYKCVNILYFGSIQCNKYSTMSHATLNKSPGFQQQHISCT